MPIFAEKFGVLSSTQDEIKEVLLLQKISPFTNHLEVETYTWEVIPTELKLPYAGFYYPGIAMGETNFR